MHVHAQYLKKGFFFESSYFRQILMFLSVIEIGKLKDGAELTRKSARENISINSAWDNTTDKPGPTTHLFYF